MNLTRAHIYCQDGGFTLERCNPETFTTWIPEDWLGHIAAIELTWEDGTTAIDFLHLMRDGNYYSWVGRFWFGLDPQGEFAMLKLMTDRPHNHSTRGDI